MTEGRLVFLGYRAKQPWLPAPEFDPKGRAGVAEVCSVSDCLSEPPPGWEKRWDFNRAACYGSAVDAAASIPAHQRGSYAVFAYWLLPGAVDASLMFDATLPLLPTGDGPTRVDVLGFDVVEMEARATPGASRLPPFGHSPLSCNLLAGEVPVNRFCLVDTEEAARRLVERFNLEQPEPGTYFAVLVAREQA